MSMRTGEKGTMADDRRDKFLKYTRDELERFLTDRGVSVNNETHEELAEKVYWAEKLGMPVKPSPAPPAETGRADRSGKLELDGGLVRLPRPETLIDGWEDGSASLPYITRDNIDRFIEAADKETVALGKDLFQSGLVQTLQYHGISANISYSFVRAKVIPRAESTHQAFMTWVVLHREDGNICLSECGCSVGLQKACEHVIAILFAVVGVHEAGASQTTNSSTLQHEMQGLPLENDPTTCIDKPQRMQGISAANKVIPGDVTQTSLNESNLESRSHPNKHTNLLDADSQHRPAISGQPATIEKDVLPATDTPPSTSLHQDVHLKQDTHMEVRGSSIKTSHFHQEAVLYVECNTISMSSDEEAVEDFSGDDEQNEPQTNETMTVHEDGESSARISEQDLNSDLAPAAELNRIQIDESMSPRYEGKRKSRGEINHQQMKKRRPVVVLEKLDKYIDTDLLLGPEDCRRLTISSEQDISNRMDLQSRGKLQSISSNQDVSEPKRENKVDVTKDFDVDADQNEDNLIAMKNMHKVGETISRFSAEREFESNCAPSDDFDHFQTDNVICRSPENEEVTTQSEKNCQGNWKNRQPVVVLTKTDISKLIKSERFCTNIPGSQSHQCEIKQIQETSCDETDFETQNKTQVDDVQSMGKPQTHSVPNDSPRRTSDFHRQGTTLPKEDSGRCQGSGEGFSEHVLAPAKHLEYKDGQMQNETSHRHKPRKPAENRQEVSRKYRTHQIVKEQNICQVCGKDFGKRKWDLKRHMTCVRVHNREKPFKCEECGKAFSDKAGIKKHHRKQHPDKPSLTHTGEKSVQCDKCGKYYSDERNLGIHMRSHTGERPYKCQECGKAFRYAGNYRDHMKHHSGIKRFACPVCGKTFFTSSNRNVHAKTHEEIKVKPHKCLKCDKAFRMKSQLASHMEIHSEDRPYMCEHCGKTFKMKGNLQSHFNTHSDKNVHKCPKCEKCYKSSRSLQRHMVEHNAEMNHKIHKCDVCDKTFKVRSYLVQHMVFHTERTHECQYCGKKFAKSTGLRTHVRTHTGEKPYKCKVCDYTCGDRGNLCKHERKHAGKKTS